MFQFIRRILTQLAEAGAPSGEPGMTTLESEADLEQCLERSHQGAVFILKHSTRCPISAGALQQVQAYRDTEKAQSLPIYINYVVESRPVSNRIAATLGVAHASPQVILVRDGQACWDISHGGITAASLTAAAGDSEARKTE